MACHAVIPSVDGSSKCIDPVTGRICYPGQIVRTNHKRFDYNRPISIETPEIRVVDTIEYESDKNDLSVVNPNLA